MNDSKDNCDLKWRLKWPRNFRPRRILSDFEKQKQNNTHTKYIEKKKKKKTVNQLKRTAMGIFSVDRRCDISSPPLTSSQPRRTNEGKKRSTRTSNTIEEESGVHISLRISRPPLNSYFVKAGLRIACRSCVALVLVLLGMVFTSMRTACLRCFLL